jgi:hypothetical protein
MIHSSRHSRFISTALLFNLFFALSSCAREPVVVSDKGASTVTTEVQEPIVEPLIVDEQGAEQVEIHNPAGLSFAYSSEVYLNPTLKASLELDSDGKAILHFLENDKVSPVPDITFDFGDSEFFSLQVYYIDDQNIVVYNNYDPDTSLSFYFYDGAEWAKLPVSEKIEEFLVGNRSDYRPNTFWKVAFDLEGEIPGYIDIAVAWNPTLSTPPVNQSLSFNVRTREVISSNRKGY